jgi:hypothetical protein
MTSPEDEGTSEWVVRECQIDMWSLGFVLYSLSLPSSLDEEDRRGLFQLMMSADANGQLLTELQGQWPDAEAEQLKVLAAVIIGALRRDSSARLTAKDAVRLLGGEYIYHYGT